MISTQINCFLYYFFFLISNLFVCRTRSDRTWQHKKFALLSKTSFFLKHMEQKLDRKSKPAIVFSFYNYLKMFVLRMRFVFFNTNYLQYYESDKEFINRLKSLNCILFRKKRRTIHRSRKQNKVGYEVTSQKELTHTRSYSG